MTVLTYADERATAKRQKEEEGRDLGPSLLILSAREKTTRQENKSCSTWSCSTSSKKGHSYRRGGGRKFTLRKGREGEKSSECGRVLRNISPGRVRYKVYHFARKGLIGGGKVDDRKKSEKKITSDALIGGEPLMHFSKKRAIEGESHPQNSRNAPVFAQELRRKDWWGNHHRGVSSITFKEGKKKKGQKHSLEV